MNKFSGILFVLLVLLLPVPVYALSIGEIYQGSTNYFHDWYGSIEQAQSFNVSGYSDSIDLIKVGLIKVGNPNNGTLKIYSDNNGVPGSLLALNTFSKDSVGTSCGLVTVRSTSVGITNHSSSSQRYWYSVSGGYVDSSNKLRICSYSSDIYAVGYLAIYDSFSSSWSTDTRYDHQFDILYSYNAVHASSAPSWITAGGNYSMPYTVSWNAMSDTGETSVDTPYHYRVSWAYHGNIPSTVMCDWQTGTTCQLTGLAQGYDYDIEIKGKDHWDYTHTDAGHQGVGSTTLNVYVPDTTPPSSISIPSVTESSNHYINFSWVNPGGDYSKVMVYKNGVFQANVTAPQNYYLFSGLNDGASYTISTHSVDTSGNINTTWVNRTWSTYADCVTGQSCQLNQTAVGTIGAISLVGQTFKILSTDDYAIITSIQVPVGRTASLSGNLCTNLYATSGGLPYSVIATSCLSNLSVDVNQSNMLNWEFVFSNSINISTNTLYAFAISGYAVENPVPLYGYSETTSYAIGNRVYNNGASWSDLTGDLSFIIQYTTGNYPAPWINYWVHNFGDGVSSVLNVTNTTNVNFTFGSDQAMGTGSQGWHYVVNNTEVFLDTSGLNRSSRIMNFSEGSYIFGVYGDNVNGTSNRVNFTINSVYDPPVITSWSHNYSAGNETVLNVTSNRYVRFNFSADQAMGNSGFLGWHYLDNGSEIFRDATGSSVSNYALNFTPGTHSFRVYGDNENGTSNSINFTVNSVALVPPVIYSQYNDFTHNDVLWFETGVPKTVGFVAYANQVVTYHWILNSVPVGAYDSYSTTISSPGVTSVKVYATNENGTSNTVEWVISSSYLVFDPSGYVNDTSGSPVYNAEVRLNNATWTDPCTGTSHCWTNALGFWDTNIYANGIYTYTVTADGYITATGTRDFVIGSTNNNFTVTLNRGFLTGHVYEHTSGVPPYRGEFALKQYEKISLNPNQSHGASLIYLGSTLTWYDGFVWKFYDTSVFDSRTGMFNLLYNGVVVDYCYAKAGDTCKVLVSEQSSGAMYMTLKVESVFISKETTVAQVIPGVSLQPKQSFLEMLSNFVFLHYASSYYFLFQDKKSDEIAHFWKTLGHDKQRDLDNYPATGENICGGEFESYGTGSDSFFVSEIKLPLNNVSYNLIDSRIYVATGGDPRSVDYYYSDNDVLNYASTKFPATGYNTISGISDTACVNGYSFDKYPFNTIDVNGDNYIRLWVRFPAGGTKPLLLYNFWSDVSCVGCDSKPLSGVQIYYVNGSQGRCSLCETETSSTGSYSVIYPLNTSLKTYFFKNGYEVKNYTFYFTSSNRSQIRDVIINRTNETVNDGIDQVWVSPGTYTIGQSATVNWQFNNPVNKGTTKRVILKLFGSDNVLVQYDDISDVDWDYVKNINEFGWYEIYGQWWNGFFNIGTWVTSAYNNFTVRSTVPAVFWDRSSYYKGDTMRLYVDVPSGTSSRNVSILYPNTSMYPGYPKSFTSTEGIQEVKINTVDSNGTLLLPVGKYIAKITGSNNASVTELYNINNTDYMLSAPASAKYGETIVVKYTSPFQTELTFKYSNGYNIIKPYLVQTPYGERPFNTSLAGYKNQVIVVQLVRDGFPVRSVNVSIGVSGYDNTDLENSNDLMYNYKTMVYGYAGKSASTLFFFGILQVIAFGLGMMYLTQFKLPLAGLMGGFLGLGLSVQLSFIPLVWGVILVILCGVTVMTMMKKS